VAEVDALLPKNKKKKKLGHQIEINDIPFLPNLQGKTPLHISIKKNNTRFTDKMITLLAETDFDHHSRFVIDKLHKLVDTVPQAFGFYLENREKATAWVQKYNRGKLEPLPECEFRMVSNQMWHETLDPALCAQMFNEEVIEVPLTMSVLDLPDMQKYKNKNADKLLEVLSETENIELFGTASLRAIVEIKWPMVKAAMNKYLLVPYLLLLLTFMYYTLYLFEYLQDSASQGEKEDLGWDIRNPKFWVQNQKQLVKLLIMALAIYFFLLEFRQFVNQGFAKYFRSPWNYIDLIPLSLITFSMLIEYLIDFPQTERAINSISIFFLWIKFLYFLRMHRASAKFISMIVAVISDMKIFLAVFTVSLVTFSQSMYIISNNNPNPDDRFISSFFDSMLFTYRIALGDWDTSGLGKTDVLIILTLFILSTLFLCIIMLNLLIAIISDTYARVEGTSQNDLYKNLADLIIENEYLVPGSLIQEHDSQGSYLYIAKVEQNEIHAEAWDLKIQDLRKTMVKRTFIVDKVAREFAKQLTKALEASQTKFDHFYTDETAKNETKFKQVLKKLDASPQKHEDPAFRRNVSTE